MTALLTVERGNTEKVGLLIAEARRMGIEVLPPDVNHSGLDFTIEDESGRQEGRPSAMGWAPSRTWAKVRWRRSRTPARLEARSQDIDDFCQRVDLRLVNRRALECLIKAGALSPFGTRAQLLAVMDRMMSISQQAHGAAQQFTMFDMPAFAVTARLASDLPPMCRCVTPGGPGLGERAGGRLYLGSSSVPRLERPGEYHHRPDRPDRRDDGRAECDRGRHGQLCAADHHQKGQSDGLCPDRGPARHHRGGDLSQDLGRDRRSSGSRSASWSCGARSACGAGKPSIIVDSVTNEITTVHAARRDRCRHRPQAEPVHIHVTVPRNSDMEQVIKRLGQVYDLLQVPGRGPFQPLCGERRPGPDTDQLSQRYHRPLRGAGTGVARACWARDDPH